MADGYVAAAIDELPGKWNGFARLVREGTGITAFGVQIMNLPPDYATHSHDESESGQEELYIALRGSGHVLIDAEDKKLPLDADHLVKVDPGVARTLTSGPEGLRALCVGGTPGKAYEIQEWTTGDDEGT